MTELIPVCECWWGSFHCVCKGDDVKACPIKPKVAA